MKFKTKLLAAGLALGAVSVPASAQVQGRLATADYSRAIVNTNAIQTAFNQIGTTYQAQIADRQAKQEQLATLLQPFDTNGNGQLDDSEVPAIQGSENFQQIQTLNQQIDQINNQVNAARIYAVEQVLTQYRESLESVTSQQQIVMVVQPEVLQYVAEGADITGQITTALNSRVPSAQIVPPADWRPSREAAQAYQQIQQLLIRQQVIQQQQAAQQGQQPAAQAPSGR
ncbi:OmpH family outer membrane protein [Erythrobacter sp.]|uniref:OmpH family outer membrane protein n=1 Tax=Erythrobacter sp. TaxID=1042 RepID=UPI003C76D710